MDDDRKDNGDHHSLAAGTVFDKAYRGMVVSQELQLDPGAIVLCAKLLVCDSKSIELVIRLRFQYESSKRSGERIVPLVRRCEVSFVSRW